jgi:hypothetical protein
MTASLQGFNFFGQTQWAVMVPAAHPSHPRWSEASQVSGRPGCAMGLITGHHPCSPEGRADRAREGSDQRDFVVGTLNGGITNGI